jgi:hypothetical protein
MEEPDMNWRKSRHSNGGENACVEVASAPWPTASYTNGGENCVEVGTAPWRKASYSSNGGATCVETASDEGAILVRDTTDREGGTLSIPAQEWARFTASLR